MFILTWSWRRSNSIATFYWPFSCERSSEIDLHFHDGIRAVCSAREPCLVSPLRRERPTRRIWVSARTSPPRPQGRKVRPWYFLAHRPGACRRPPPEAWVSPTHPAVSAGHIPTRGSRSTRPASSLRICSGAHRERDIGGLLKVSARASLYSM